MMKRICLTVTLVVFMSILNGFSQAKKGLDAVSMVSYEQSWLDTYGTIALKNNTSEEVYNVSFTLEYLDMQGNPMDYESFSYKISIAPGKTKKLNIPAYEHNRHYHYYKTKDTYGNPAFKLRYELKDFNYQVDEAETLDKEDFNLRSISQEYSTLIHERSRSWNDFRYTFLLLFLLGSFVLAAVVAQKKNRNVVVWLLLCLVLTPCLVCIILLALPNEDKGDYYHS